MLHCSSVNRDPQKGKEGERHGFKKRRVSGHKRRLTLITRGGAEAGCDTLYITGAWGNRRGGASCLRVQLPSEKGDYVPLQETRRISPASQHRLAAEAAKEAEEKHSTLRR